MAAVETFRKLNPISADSHIVEPPDCWTKFIDPKYRDSAPRIVRDPKRGDLYVIPNMEGGTFGIGAVAAAGLPSRDIRMDGWKFEELHRGGWDPKARVADMDRDGVAAELIFPTTGMMLFSHPDTDYVHAGLTAYNRWQEEFIAGAPNRLFGVGTTIMRSPKEFIAQMEDFKRKGFKAVMLPEIPVQEDFDSPIYDEAWTAAVELGLPLCFHILAGSRSAPSAMRDGLRGGRLTGFMATARINQDLISIFTFGGVFDRHPKLRLVSVEADAGWLPHFLFRMNHGYNRHRFWLKGRELSKLPSEFVKENVYLTFQDDLVAWQSTRMEGWLNPERLLWASDYPHSDSTWPHSPDTVAAQTQGVDPAIVRKVVSENSAKLFNIAVN